MQGVHSLQDLRAKLTLAGFEVKGSEGWYLESPHGRWTMAHGVVYLNREPVLKIPEFKTKTKKKVKR
jgi:hypothetical protein